MLTLTGSKSICNRALLIRALSKTNFCIDEIAAAKDSQTLHQLLENPPQEVYNVGPAATPFRFLTAYLALQHGTQILTGTEGLKKRPMKVLVDALNSLGANVEYMEKEGYAPLKVNSPNKTFAQNNEVTMRADVTSQFISAMLLIAPTLPNGLKIYLEGTIVEKPYVDMTLKVMSHFGIQHDWQGDTISISHQDYIPKDFKVEADWSAASYHYAIAAFSEECDLQLNNLFEESTQGDSVVKDIMHQFGVITNFNKDGVHLQKIPSTTENFDYDFLDCPDLVQAVATVCAGLGIKAIFKNLEVLRIKETNRIEALCKELRKIGISFIESEPDVFTVQGKAYAIGKNPEFDTYDDHRMAMALSPFAMVIGPIIINDAWVVLKSYPDFWKDFKSLGFLMEEVYK